MKPLRPLAEGWEYEIVNEIGTRYSRAFAPPECFADAKPEEGLVEERTLRSPDGAFVMTVWLKDDPLRIEARIEQQPEEWRQHSCGDKMLIHAPEISVSSWAYPSFCVGALRLRGHQRHQDNEVFPFWFGCHIDRDAYLAKLEATVAAMPRLADQFRVEDRVVVAGKQCETAPPLAPAIGLHGRICWIGKNVANGGFCDICTDDGKILTGGLINLRHERADERPAGPKQEPPPVHMTAALVDGRIQVNLDPVEEK